MRHRPTTTLIAIATLTLICATIAVASPASRRAEIDVIADETIDKLLVKSDKAKELYEKAYGYAVFDNVKISLGVTGGGGAGVAVRRDSGERVYMKMGTAGLNLGLGGQKYQVVFLFQDGTSFDRFIDQGWQAEAGANASAADKGVNKGTNFVNGMAVYQFTDKGLMLQADISGTKYWKAKKLNRDEAE